jgi:hypothetical protein
MVVAIASAIVASILSSLVVYFLIQGRISKVEDRLNNQRDYILDLEECLEGIMDLFDRVSADVDMLASDGPQPETNKAPVNPKPQAVNVDDGNVIPLESDGLPLQGHTICVGQSGSGKSNVGMSQIIRRLRDGQRMYCIDTKNELGPIFRRHMIEVVKPPDGEALIRRLLDIAEERQQLFERTSEELEMPCRDYGEYFKRTGEKLPIICLVVEEMIVLMPIMGQDLLIQLLVLGRSAGVFVFAMAQYLKADILDRKGSVNFNTRIFMGKYDAIGVGILFGNMEKAEAGQVREFVGSPGKAAVDENGMIRLVTLPRVEDYHLAPYMRKGDK